MARVILISYVHKDSFIHKLNPMTKLAVTACAVILSFILRDFTHNLILFSLIIPLGFIAKLLRQVFQPIKFLYLIFVLLFIIQGLFYPYRETVLFTLPFGIQVWTEGVLYASIVSSRLLVMMVYGFLFVLTTHPGDLVSALRKLKMPYTFAYVILSTLQMIPRVQSQMTTIVEAQKSRGLETEGNVINRLKSYAPLLGPLFLISVQQAVERAIALESRSFSSKIEKTDYRKTKILLIDKVIIILAITFSIIGGVLSWVL